jgi:hypothetical protein
MAKPKPNHPGEDGQIRSIDILALELENNLPYWLSPQEQYSHMHDEARRAKHRAYMDEKYGKQKRKKAWARERKRAERLTKD